MDDIEIVKKTEQLVKSHKLDRWIQLGIYLSTLAASFYLLSASYGEPKDTFIYHLAAAKVHIFVASLSGAMIGITLSNWNGSKELKLLMEIASKHDQT